MKEFAESKFWKCIAVGLVAAIFYLGWAISHNTPDLIALPAHAQTLLERGALESSGSYIMVTNQEGNKLYCYEFEKSATNVAPRLKEVHKFNAP